jgi:hypothetical protein
MFLTAEPKCAAIASFDSCSKIVNTPPAARTRSDHVGSKSSNVLQSRIRATANRTLSSRRRAFSTPAAFITLRLRQPRSLLQERQHIAYREDLGPQVIAPDAIAQRGHCGWAGRVPTVAVEDLREVDRRQGPLHREAIEASFRGRGMEARVDGKVALLTGATQGVGRAIAETLARSGAAGLLLTGRRRTSPPRTSPTRARRDGWSRPAARGSGGSTCWSMPPGRPTAARCSTVTRASGTGSST